MFDYQAGEKFKLTLLMVGFAVAMFLVPLMRKITPPGAPSANAH